MLSRLKAGIARTRAGLRRSIERLKGAHAGVDQETLDELEIALLQADVGVPATARIVAAVARASGELDGAALINREMSAILTPCEQELVFEHPDDGPFVVLVVGVNGVGKTTTMAKLGQRLQAAGKSVMFAAGDTFRAAAIDQLATWGARLDIPVIAQGNGADSAAVIFDACAAAQARAIDVLIADTAGRLHTHGHLMEELAKVRRVIKKYDERAPHETLLVLDATMGQNALNQAREFGAAVAVSGLCLTKLDGSAKGGIVFALAEDLGLPIRYVGMGETAADLAPFSADEFVHALLGDFAGTEAS